MEFFKQININELANPENEFFNNIAEENTSNLSYQNSICGCVHKSMVQQFNLNITFLQIGE